MMITAAMAREMSNRAKPADTSLEIAMNKIVESAKLGFFGTNVRIPKEHVDEVIKRLSDIGFVVQIDEEWVFYSTIQIDWGTKA